MVGGVDRPFWRSARSTWRFGISRQKRAGLPLWNLLSGYDPRVPCYAGGIDIRLSPEELVVQTHDNMAKGHRAIKMKVGRDCLSEKEVAKMAATRDAFGKDRVLMTNDNMKFTVDGAILAVRAFRDFNLVWFEEPIPPDDPAGHRCILTGGSIPIA